MNKVIISKKNIQIAPLIPLIFMMFVLITLDIPSWLALFGIIITVVCSAIFIIFRKDLENFGNRLRNRSTPEIPGIVVWDIFFQFLKNPADTWLKYRGK